MNKQPPYNKGPLCPRTSSLSYTELKAPFDFHVILQRLFSGRWLSPLVSFYVLGKHVNKPFSTGVRKGKNGRKRKKGRVKIFYLLINLGCKLWKIHIYYTLTICLQQHSSKYLSHRQKLLFHIRTKSKPLETQRMGLISSGSRYKWTKSSK